jgi:hypothetical protein
MKDDIFITRGNIEILNQKKVVLFSSKDTPPQIYSSIELLFDTLRKMDLAIAGGWQAPFEKKLFKKIKASDRANYIHYLAKDLNQVSLNESQEYLVNNDKLLLIAADIKQTRIDKSLVKERDELIFSQNNRIIFLYISEGGRLEEYFKQLNVMQYQIYVLDHPLNKHLITKDVIALNQENVDLLVL